MQGEYNMKQCLMIKTKDHKNFFTHEKNLPQLIEFSRTFNAEISTVQISSEVEVLELEELAPALCEMKSQKTDYKILEIKLRPKEDRRKILYRARKIQKHIHDSLIKGKTVSLKGLINKYKNQKLTTACLCNHFKLTRDKMESEGYLFVKTGGGSYKVIIS